MPKNPAKFRKKCLSMEPNFFFFKNRCKTRFEAIRIVCDHFWGKKNSKKRLNFSTKFWDFCDITLSKSPHVRGMVIKPSETVSEGGPCCKECRGEKIVQKKAFRKKWEALKVGRCGKKYRFLNNFQSITICSQ